MSLYGGTHLKKTKRQKDKSLVLHDRQKLKMACPVPKCYTGGRWTWRRGRNIFGGSGSGESPEEEGKGNSKEENEEPELDGPIQIETTVTSDK